MKQTNGLKRIRQISFTLISISASVFRFLFIFLILISFLPLIPPLPLSRFAWFGASSWTNRAALCRNGLDLFAPPETAKNRTWRRCQTYLVDRYIRLPVFQSSLSTPRLDASPNLLLSFLNCNLCFLDFLPCAERNLCWRGAHGLVRQRLGPVVRHSHHSHPNARRERFIAILLTLIAAQACRERKVSKGVDFFLSTCLRVPVVQDLVTANNRGVSPLSDI